MSMDLSSRAPGTSAPGVLVADVPTSVAPACPARSIERRDLVRIFLVLLALTFVLRLPAFFVPVFNSDETFLATQAHVISDGGELYEDAIDRKPPLVPYVYAATFAFFGTTALWSVRVVAMLAVALTALLLAIEARRRYGARGGWIAGDAVRGGDGHVHAARRAGRELRGVHAAVDDGGHPVRDADAGAARGGGDRRSPRSPSRPARPRCCPSSTCSRRERGKRGVAEVVRRVHASRSRSVALLVGSAPALLLDGARQRLVRRREDASTMVVLMFVAHDVGMWSRATCRSCGSSRAAWQRPRLARARRQRDTDLWLWLAVGRGVGRGRPALLRPLLHAADPAAGAAGRRRARRAAVAVRASATIVVRARRRRRVLGRRRTSSIRSVPEPNYESVSPLPRHHHQPRRPDLRVGQRARDLLGVGAAARRRASSRRRSSPATTRAVRRPTPTPATTPRQRGRTSTRTSPRTRPSTSSTRHRRRCAAPQYYPISDFPRLEHIVDTQYHYVVTIDGIDVYKRK